MRPRPLPVPPPVFFVASFLLGVALERGLPPPARPQAEWFPWITFAVLGCGFLLAPLNAVRFLVRRTTLNPNRVAHRLFTGGIYAFSRNPMYVGMFLIYSGVALKLWHPGAFATIWIPFLILNQFVVPYEEKLIAAKFGGEFETYRARVRRWV
jgi:protein-S-isoprenylcysteine O-methyltransferase Ste14